MKRLETKTTSIAGSCGRFRRDAKKARTSLDKHACEYKTINGLKLVHMLSATQLIGRAWTCGRYQPCAAIQHSSFANGRVIARQSIFIHQSQLWERNKKKNYKFSTTTSGSSFSCCGTKLRSPEGQHIMSHISISTTSIWHLPRLESPSH